jgi:hypothetical protein
VTIKAISLLDADRVELTKAPGTCLQKKSFDDYAKTIVERNLFAAYSPPPPPTPPRRDPPPGPAAPSAPAFDHLEFTILTAVIEADGRFEAWVKTKTTGKTYYLHEGEEVSVEGLKAKVGTIGPRELVLEIGEERRSIPLGRNLLGK